MTALAILTLAFIAEAVWETLKMVWQNGKFSIDRIGALVVGLLIAFASGFDILSFVGISSKVPFVGIVFAGLLISRGSNFMHDILGSLGNLRENTRDNGHDA